jgi:hypothetical protein
MSGAAQHIYVALASCLCVGCGPSSAPFVAGESGSSDGAETAASTGITTSGASMSTTSAGSESDAGDGSSGDVPERRVVGIGIAPHFGADVCITDDTEHARCWGALTAESGYGELPSMPSDQPAWAFGDLGLESPVLAMAPQGPCVLYPDSSAACWGDESSGLRGTGEPPLGDEREPAVAPALVAIDDPIVDLAASGHHRCAVTAIGDVYCWGANESGQLGYGHTEAIGDDETPAAAGPVELGGVAVDVEVSLTHSCAILEGGVVRCWGDNGDAQLGYPDLYEAPDAPAQHLGDDELPTSVDPVDVGAPVQAIALGDAHTCALLEGGSVRCWGSYYTLGDAWPGPLADDEVPAALPTVDIGAPAIALATHESITCVITEAGGVRCWGHGVWEKGYGGAPAGEDADLGDDEAPAVAGDISLGGPATEIAVGYGICAVLEGGVVRCWGSADVQGQGVEEVIGDDEVPTDWPPTPVFGP